MKKETLEEAAERLFRNESGDMSKYRARNIAIELAKWQAERMYSEEEVFSIIEATLIEYSDFARDSERWFEQFKNK